MKAIDWLADSYKNGWFGLTRDVSMYECLQDSIDLKKSIEDCT